MKLSEALETRKIGYEGSRPDYQIHDPNPNILMLDKDYSYDGNGKSVLGFNLNYLDGLNKRDKSKLLKRINKVDNSVLELGAVKAWIRTLLNKGVYDNLSVNKKIERYQELVKQFPELKKIIRRYKYSAISKGM